MRAQLWQIPHCDHDAGELGDRQVFFGQAARHNPVDGRRVLDSLASPGVVGSAMPSCLADEPAIMGIWAATGGWTD